MLFAKDNQWIQGKYIVDNKTKNLIRRILPDQIAILNHLNIDEVAAKGLIEKKVKAIINLSTSYTGNYPTLGLKKLLEANIYIFDVKDSREIFPLLRDDQSVEIDIQNHKAIFFIYEEKLKVNLEIWTLNKWEKFYNESEQNIVNELNHFIDNTLEYARREKDLVLQSLSIPPIQTQIQGKNVVVVVRGEHFQEDLYVLRHYIHEVNPVLIGVDGGADALIGSGYKPDIIIGDMDSVSDDALLSGAEIIVHAYPDGRAPGLKRIQDLGLKAKIIPAKGTSEDIALLLAYEQQAEIIVALGTHSHMIDFLEKGRKGMASTALVRMKIGNKLIDAKGVHKLYHKQGCWKPRIFEGYLTAAFPFITMLSFFLSLVLGILVGGTLSRHWIQPISAHYDFIYLIKTFVEGRKG